ncbi:metal tolerance protein 9 [Biomphalaria pfeifferi]|uniref:Metal tolerance protein 9 n=1 Tax=Biomphalaria pfeifferi TaxID=112525 RepID=A0AAD8BW06_BIOPF|nr:metal tolerance protein 9 [Biomphalaria pfeifferi]
MEGDTVDNVQVVIVDPSRVKKLGSGDNLENNDADGGSHGPDDAEMHLLSPKEEIHHLHTDNSREDLIGLAPKRLCHGQYSEMPSPQHTVRMMEVEPVEGRESNISLSWKMPLHKFSSKKSDNLGVEIQKAPKGIKAFYKRQDELIQAYENMATDSKIDVLSREAPAPGVIVTRLSQISFAANLALMIAKAVAVGMSNSMSIISSLVDSVVDLLSGLIIWWTTHAIKKSSIYVYPVGRSRLEPVAIIILSVIMSLASLEVLISSIKKIVGFTSSLDDIAVFDVPTLIISCSIIVTKFVLALSFYLIMKKKKIQSDPVGALIQDHRNDTVSNLVAIVCGYLGSRQFANEVGSLNVAYIDPAGAIVIGLYIIISWWKTGIAQLKMVVGYTANPDFLSQITWISLNHSPKILCIDTVRAFHFGSKFLVEVDIVLQEDTVLLESHNIGESLQQKLESLPQVERAFVHVDYEVSHRPQDEHR